MNPLSQTSRILSAAVLLASPGAHAQWNGYASDPQHTGISTATVPSLPFAGIRWSTPVDDSPPTGTIYRHYGSPIVTAANTVLVPVRTSTGGYRIEAHDTSVPHPNTPFWQAATDFTTAPHDGTWIPSFSPTLTPSGALYYQGAGGTVFRVSDPNSSTVAPVRIATFPGYAANPSGYNSSVFISTPITSDNAGNIYFGYEATAGAPDGIKSGIARIAFNGTATFVAVDTATGLGPTAGLRVATNCAPAITADGTRLYVAVRDDTAGNAYLVRLDTAALNAPVVASLGTNMMFDGATASPTIGPDGHVYFGTARGGYNYRGLLRHFTADLAEPFAPGSFGWDITPSIIPRSMIPDYTGNSDYLLMVKYNDYYGYDPQGTGLNKLAILDPNDIQYDPRLNGGQNVMKEIITIAGVTPDGPAPRVREWCINTAAVDLLTKSILVNSEDGILYRWDLPGNRFSESIVLQAEGVLEAYTPTAIGPDGTIYAINKARLFAVVPEPGSTALLALGGMLLCGRRRRYGASGSRICTRFSPQARFTAIDRGQDHAPASLL